MRVRVYVYVYARSLCAVMLDAKCGRGRGRDCVRLLLCCVWFFYSRWVVVGGMREIAMIEDEGEGEARDGGWGRLVDVERALV